MGRPSVFLNGNRKLTVAFGSSVYEIAASEAAMRQAMNQAFSKGEIYEGPYLTARAYKNGNIHLEFTRQDLLDKANRIIAEFCGLTLAKKAA